MHPPVETKIAALEGEIDALHARLLTLPLQEQYRLAGRLGSLIRRWRWYQARLPLLQQYAGKGSHLWHPPTLPKNA